MPDVHRSRTRRASMADQAGIVGWRGCAEMAKAPAARAEAGRRETAETGLCPAGCHKDHPGAAEEARTLERNVYGGFQPTHAVARRFRSRCGRWCGLSQPYDPKDP